MNTWGSYRCTCSKGYRGNGHVCKGEGFCHVRKSIAPADGGVPWEFLTELCHPVLLILAPF